MSARVGLVILALSLPGTASLKEKRSRLRPVLEGIKRDFEVSVAETGHRNLHDRAEIAAAVVGNDPRHLDQVMARIAASVERHDVLVEDYATEVL